MHLFHAGTGFIRAKFLRDFEGWSSYSVNSSVQQTLLVSRLAAHVERAGVAGVIAGFFTVVGWPKSLLFGQGSGRFVTAVKSMIVSGRIS